MMLGPFIKSLKPKRWSTKCLLILGPVVLEFRTNPDRGPSGVTLPVGAPLPKKAPPVGAPPCQGIRGWFSKIRKFWHTKFHLFQLFDNEFVLVLFVILKVAGNPDVRERVAGGFENSDTPGRGRSENLRFWRMF